MGWRTEPEAVCCGQQLKKWSVKTLLTNLVFLKQIKARDAVGDPHFESLTAIGYALEIAP